MLPLVVVANPRSGSGDKRAELEEATAAFDAAGHPYHVIEFDGDTAERACERAAHRAAQVGGAIVAAGGDGTVNTAANAARDAGAPLGLLPTGTFNYFAKEQGIPLEPADAAKVLMQGILKPVSMGELNGRLFFNNAGFGLYTEAVRRREAAKSRLGRYQAVAVAATISAVLAGRKPFAVHMVVGNLSTIVHTSTVLVFSNSLQLEALGLKVQEYARAGALAVALLRPTRLRDRLRLLLRTALKQLDEDGRVQSFGAMEFEVHSARPVIDVVMDGEESPVRQPLRFRAVPDAVQLIVP